MIVVVDITAPVGEFPAWLSTSLYSIAPRARPSVRFDGGVSWLEPPSERP